MVAAFNEERLLPRCLDALADLAGDERVEIIVVDNGSTDRTAEIAAARAGVRVIHEERRGAVHAKAAGVRVARGRLVAILDADSICPAHWVAQIASRFRADPELVGLTGPARYAGTRSWVPFVAWWWYAGWRFLSMFARRPLYAVGTNVAFRRDAYLQSSGFDTGVLVGGDEVALFSALARVGRTRFDPELVVETDDRRMSMGFLRFTFEIVILRYVVNYTYYRLTGRTLLREYPPGSTLRSRRQS